MPKPMRREARKVLFTDFLIDYLKIIPTFLPPARSFSSRTLSTSLSPFCNYNAGQLSDCPSVSAAGSEAGSEAWVGASSSDLESGEATKLHSKIRWYKPMTSLPQSRRESTTSLVYCPNISTQQTPRTEICLAPGGANGHYEIVDLLISRGAKLNAKNFNGNTALHMSMEYGFDNAVHALLQKGGPKR